MDRVSIHLRIIQKLKTLHAVALSGWKKQSIEFQEAFLETPLFHCMVGNAEFLVYDHFDIKKWISIVFTFDLTRRAISKLGEGATPIHLTVVLFLDHICNTMTHSQ